MDNNGYILPCVTRFPNWYGIGLLIYKMRVWFLSEHHCVLPLGKLLTHVRLCHHQYNLVPAKGVISLTGKVTLGLVESYASLPTGLTNVTYGLTAKKPGSAPYAQRSQSSMGRLYFTYLFRYTSLHIVTEQVSINAISSKANLRWWTRSLQAVSP